MKKMKNFAYVGAIALLSVTGFTACSSSDSVAERDPALENPTYDPVKDAVTAQFVLNIASDTRNNSSLRSAGTTVQAGGENFRGIDNTVLFAYKTSGTRFVNATAAGAAAANRYDLGSLVASGTLDNDGSNSRRIVELSIPTGTDAVLFYGKAMKGTLNNDEAGKVTYTIPASTATLFNFALNQRVATADQSRYEHTAQLLAAVMTKIIQAESSYTVEKTGDPGDRFYPDWTGADVLTATWKELNPTTQQRSLSPLEEILYKAFDKLTTIEGDELRAGSSRAIITTVKDLRSVILKVTTAVPTTPYEELAQRVASNINTRINAFFTDEIAGLKSIGNTKEAFGADWNNDWNDIDNNEYQNFPITNFHLPEGAAMLVYNAGTNSFSHKHPGTNLLDNTGTADASSYMFPAELMYYCNSSIRTSNVEKTSTSGFPNGVANWDDNSKWDADWTGTSVTSSTRATAMTKNVNYGVAMLKTTVGIKEGVTQLEDNRSLNEEETNQTFAPADIDFTLTGVIIGGQPEAVDWQFLPTSNTFGKFVYDNRVTGLDAGTAVPKTAGGVSSPNYTILFDNYNSTGGDQNKVRVGLQLVNNGDDFWGRDNLIRKGQTFYLVGELDPAGKAIAEANWDEYYQVPPLDASGNSTKTTRVFVQDYMTTAHFNITSSSLQNAFVTLPDLRSSQLSFGLSVDLDWKPGLEFSVDLGGN